LARLKLSRSLTDIPELVATLEAFKGTEYSFSSVFAEGESIDLLKQIDAVLKRAEWKRVGAGATFPSIVVYGKNSPDTLAVTSGLGTGIEVSVDFSEPYSSIQSLPLDKMPPVLKAALTLNLALFNSISPRQEGTAKTVNVPLGTSPIVRIDVGKKP
jgi:hypothetical protein